MHIGIIGGIGPGATDYYYRQLIAALAARGKRLELTMVHADAPTLLQNLAARDAVAQAAIFNPLIERLKTAGAELAAVTSIAGHFCIADVEKSAALPLCNLIDSVAKAVAQSKLEKVGLIGTRTVMDSHFYGRLPDLQIILPTADELDLVHQSYVDMATLGQVNEAQRQVFFDVGRRLCQDQGAQAVMLGGTDLFLAFEGQDCGFELVDCAKIHIDALARFAADEV